MRSLAARLLRVLSDAGESPPDFLCPCQDPPQPQPGPSTHRLRRRTDVASFPRKYVRGEDGIYRVQPVFNYHGQSIVCSLASPSSTDGVDFASENGDSAYVSEQDDIPEELVEVATPSPSLSATGVVPEPSTLPVGWHQSPSRYPQTNVVITSTVLAGFITLLIFVLVFWRPLFGSRRKKKGHGDKASDDRDADSMSSVDIEKAATALDEDPALRRAIRAKRRQFERALARWKAKARGKAAHVRDKQRGRSTASIASPSSSSFHDAVTDTLLPRSRSSSTSTSRPAGANHTVSTALTPSLSSDAIRVSPSLVAPGGIASSTTSEVGGIQDGACLVNVPVAVPGPPAYRRSLPAVGGPMVPEIAVSTASGIRTTEKQGLPLSILSSLEALSDSIDIRASQGGVDANDTLLVSASSSAPPAARRRPFVHVATDDKATLADLAMHASAPEEADREVGIASPSYSDIASQHVPHLAIPEATAPSWDDDVELDRLIGSSSISPVISAPNESTTPVTTTSLKLPHPPRRMPSRSLGLGSAFDGDDMAAAALSPLLSIYPSAPPDDGDLSASAPPSEVSLEIPSAPNAPIEDDDLQHVLQSLPRYER